MTVKETLQNLLEIRGLLQEERKAADIVRRAPDDIEAAENRLQLERDKVAEALARAEEAAARNRQIDAQLHANDDRVARYASQISLAKTQQEVDALESQIAGLRESSAKLEDEGLELVEREDESRRRAQLLEMTVAKAETDTKAEIERLQARCADMESAIGMAAAERANRLATLDGEVRDMWERQAERHGPEAIVPLLKGACSGCDMSLVLQTREAVNRMDKLTRCEKCGRFLYDPEQIREP